MRTDLLSGSSPAFNYPTTSSAATPSGSTLTSTGNGSSATTATATVATPSDGATAAGQATASSPASAVDKAELKKSVEALNRYIQPQQGSLEFSIDESSGKTLLKVVDTETNEVLLQVPSKQALALSQSVGKTPGLLISDSA